MSFYILALNKFMSILNTSQAFFAWVMMQKAHTKKTQKKSFLIAQSSVKSSTKSFSVNLFFFISFNDSWKCLLLHEKVAESVFTSSILLQHVFSQCLTSLAPHPPHPLPLLITHQQYLFVNCPPGSVPVPVRSPRRPRPHQGDRLWASGHQSDLVIVVWSIRGGAKSRITGVRARTGLRRLLPLPGVLEGSLQLCKPSKNWDWTFWGLFFFCQTLG